MVIGMATTQKVTITLPIDAVDTIRGLVVSGKADSVSGFVQHAVRVALDDVSGWGAMLAQALQETGGDLTPEERAWASDALGLSRPSDVA
jgi:Arc/MetJ-type ribon-helix-helix transcriptional regulator